MATAQKAGWIETAISGGICVEIPAGTNEREPFETARTARVAQSEGEACVGRPLRPFDHVHLCVGGKDGPEQPEHLVDEMAAQIAQKSADRAGLQRQRIVKIHARMQAPQSSEPAFVEHPLQGAYVGVHPAIVEHAQHHTLRLRGRIKFTSRSSARREWLVGDHVHTRR